MALELPASFHTCPIPRGLWVTKRDMKRPQKKKKEDQDAVFIPNPGPPGMEKKAMLTISSVLISLERVRLGCGRKGEKRKPGCVSILGMQGLC